MIEAVNGLVISYLPLLAGATIGLFLLAIVAGWAMAHPRALPALLASGAVFGCGFFLGDLTVLDELLVAAVAGGGLMRFAVAGRDGTRVAQPPSGTLKSWHFLLFVLLVAYFVLQSVRGVVEFGELRKLRWVAFFLLLGLVVLVDLGSRPAEGARKRLARALTAAWVGYLVWYIGWGLFAELVRGVSRYAIQPGEWGTPAYTLSPLVVAVPAALLTLRDDQRGYRRLAVASLILSVVAAFYYDARVAVLALLVLAVFAAPGSRRAFVMIAGTIVLVAAVSINVFWSKSRDLEFFLRDTFETGSSLRVPVDRRGLYRDYDRVAHLKIAFTTLQDGRVPFLFGYGYRTSGRHIGEKLYDLLDSYGRTPSDISYDQNNVATEAFTALMVETGVVGVGLVVANVALSLLRVWRASRDPIRWVILCAGTGLLLWTVAINFLDAIWLFLAIAPSGIFVRLGLPERQPATATEPASQSARRPVALRSRQASARARRP